MKRNRILGDLLLIIRVFSSHAAKGRRKAVKEIVRLYTEYKADLFHYLLGLTHNPTIADDLLSDTFLLNEHLSECQTCKKLFEEQGNLHERASIPKVRKLKWVLFAVIALLITIGGLIGYLSSSVNTPMPLALLIISVLSLIPLAIILEKGKPDKMSKFFYGKAIGTVILFALLGIYLLLRYVFGLL